MNDTNKKDISTENDNSNDLNEKENSNDLNEKENSNDTNEKDFSTENDDSHNPNDSIPEKSIKNKNTDSNKKPEINIIFNTLEKEPFLEKTNKENKSCNLNDSKVPQKEVDKRHSNFDNTELQENWRCWSIGIYSLSITIFFMISVVIFIYLFF